MHLFFFFLRYRKNDLKTFSVTHNLMFQFVVETGKDEPEKAHKILNEPPTFGGQQKRKGIQNLNIQFLFHLSLHAECKYVDCGKSARVYPCFHSRTPSTSAEGVGGCCGTRHPTLPPLSASAH